MIQIDSVLGLKLKDVKANEVITGEVEASEDKINTLLSDLTDENINELVRIRNFYKRKKNFDMADKIRSELSKHKIKLVDTREGSTWEKIRKTS